MPNRILKESVCTSETIDALTVEAEAFFYRLMVQCDDFGRMDGRPSVLRARCFPLRLDKVTDKQVTRWLAELAAADLLWIYTIDGRDYVQITKWEKHQQIRAKHSKYPQPPERDSKCNQPPADASNSPRESRIENTRNDIADVPSASAPDEPSEPDPVKELAAVFETAAGIKLPTPTTKKAQATVGVTWWHPLREMVKLGNGTAAGTLTAAVRQMRKDGLTIRAPISCLSVFTSLHGAAVTAGDGEHYVEYS